GRAMVRPLACAASRGAGGTMKPGRAGWGRRGGLAGVAIAVAIAGSAAPVRAAGLTMEQAVAVALQRNRDVIAAKLEIDRATLGVVAARPCPNPTVGYAIGNLLLGTANTKNMPATSSFFDQPVQT